MKNILRNFWVTFTRFKMVSALNLIGLSVAFATFTIIMMQVRWEYSYGQSDTAADCIYRFDELDNVTGKYNTTQNMDVCRAFAQSSPLIVESAGVLYSRRNFKVLSQDVQNQFFNDVPTISTNDNIFKVFDITLLKGTVGEFMTPNKAIVCQSIARKMFGDQDPIGQVIKTDWGDLDKLNAIVKGVESENTPQVEFYSKHVAQLYDNEKQFGMLISLFSIVAIIISLVGVFGIVTFETQVKRKEIGLRKVFGATIIEVLEMLNYKFCYIVAVSFVIATPIAYFGMREWLSGFAYKTPIHWWVFVLAGLAVAILTVVTVTVQAYKSATENPIKSIKSE